MQMRVLRLFAALSVAAIVLLAGARAGGAFAHRGRPRSSLGVDAYPGGGDTIRVGESLEVAGQPMELSLFFTADAPDRVAEFYAKAFRARGLTPVMSAAPAPAHVAAFDPAEAVQRFVTAVPQPRGWTLVLFGTTNPRKLPRFVDQASFPVPDGHRGLLVFRSADVGSSAETGQFVSALSPRAVAAFYRASLRAEGYSETSDGAGEDMLTFLRAGSTISLAIQGLGETPGTVVFLTRSEAAGP
jgi:hypothetical protein